MFSPLDIVLGAGGVLIAVAISAPFLLLRRAGARAERAARRAAIPAPAPAPVAHELQRRAS
jgi:hypothetical protein